MSKAKAKKGAGRRDGGSGNITVDLGEAIDRKLRSVEGGARGKDVPRRAEVGRPGGYAGSYRPGGYRPGSGYRPGMFGGYRPWYASREARFGSMGRPFMGAGGTASVNIGHLVGGMAVGALGNRALVRVTPELIKVDSAVLHDGLAFIVGLIPLLAKQNSMTVGVAIPGAVFLAGSLLDWTMNKLNIKKGPSSIGSPEAPASRPQGGIDAALSARQKLADLQSRIQHAPSAPAAAGPTRVYAQAQ